MTMYESYEDENEFTVMAESDPLRLVGLLSDGSLRPADLSSAAEAAGRIPRQDVVVLTLLKLLKHESAIVREGAVYGLCYYLPSDEIYSRFKELRSSDPSDGVRSVLEDILSC